jgi:Ca2+-binding RTX toxin-like protein
LPAGGVSCDPADVRAVEAHLKDGDDTAHVVAALSARVWAGSGNDKVVADSFGAQTFVYGEGGDDEVTSGGEGGQVADGGPGDDIVNAGGFAGQGTGLGGSGDDIVYFRTWLYGPAVLDGGKGHDTIVSQPAGGTASGGDGDDIIVIHGRVPERIVPNQDGFAISGGPGADTIIGDVLADTIDGGDGRDYVDVLDGGADTVSCGSGTDVVRYDATDTVAADCEIRLGPTP